MLNWKRKVPKKLNNQNEAFKKDDLSSDSEDGETAGYKKQKLLKTSNIKHDLGNTVCDEGSSIKRAQYLASEAARLAELGEFEKALPLFEQSLQLSPHHKTFEMQAQIYNEVGHYFSAIEACEKAAKLKPNWFVVFQTLARAQANFGEIKLAVVSMEKAVHLNPNNQELQSELSEFRKLESRTHAKNE